jgi:hypothetical protein
MKDRFMGENTCLLYDLMHYLEENNKTGLLLLVDFEKAFDSNECIEKRPKNKWTNIFPKELMKINSVSIRSRTFFIYHKFNDSAHSLKVKIP